MTAPARLALVTGTTRGLGLALARALLAGGPLDDLERPTQLLVQADERGTRTVALSPEVGALLAALDGRSTDQLEADRPGFARALDALAAKGLVRLPVTAASRPELSRP